MLNKELEFKESGKVSKEEAPKVILRIRIKEVIKERGLTQKELSKMTNLNLTQINRLCNNLGSSVNRVHLGIIANALDICNVNELLEFVKVN